MESKKIDKLRHDHINKQDLNIIHVIMWGSIHKMIIGVIGNGKHSKRVQNILKKI